VAVKDIWGDYRYGKQASTASLILHSLVVGILVFVSGKEFLKKVDPNLHDKIFMPVDISPYVPTAPKPDKMGGGGGGGDRSPDPASKGRLPKFAMEQLAPPAAVIRNEDPKLAVEPTVLVPPDIKIPQVNMAQLGDPLGAIGPPSNGPGSGGGIGSGSGGGVGSGRGGGVGPGEGGGIGGGVFRVGGGVSAPQLVIGVEPEYTEAARKAKYQGTVVLYAVVDADGKVRDLKVVRALGLGLDEKALEAVRQWKFRPGMKDGRPVAVAASIEVTFRLL
jgi:TonB family protein